MEMIEQIQKHFEDNKYVVIKNFLSPETCAILYQYTILKNQRENHKYTYFNHLYDRIWDGQWGDGHVDNSYALYGDPLMDGILDLSTEKMCNFTGLKLIPQNTYWRFYERGHSMSRHIDRNSCEVSTTICLGYNLGDLDTNMYPNYSWPLWIVDPQGREIPVSLSPGDMIIYKGCDLEHWRDECKSLNHAQMFMHYNIQNSDLNLAGYWDGRVILGIPHPEKIDNK
jgi:hypothetical protein